MQSLRGPGRSEIMPPVVPDRKRQTMKIRSRRLLTILFSVLLGTLGIAAAIVGLRGYQMFSAAWELRSRGIGCSFEVPGSWWASLPGGDFIGAVLAPTDVRSSPETWTVRPLTDSDWVVSLPALRKMPAIRSVRIEYAAIGSATLATFDELPELESISLNGCNIDDDMLLELADVSRLKMLNLSNTQVSGTGVKALRDLPRLTHLNLDGAPITEDGLAEIAKLDRLTVISLSNTGLSENDVLKLEEALPGVLISDD